MNIDGTSLVSPDACGAPELHAQVDAWSHELTPPEENVWSVPSRNKHEMLTAGANTRQLAVHEAELRELRAQLHVVEELRTRLQQVERELEELMTAHDVDTEAVSKDPHSLWIEGNLEKLREYANEYVAVDPARGVIVHAVEQEEFARKLETLSAEENERVTLFHTSMYLRG